MDSQPKDSFLGCRDCGVLHQVAPGANGHSDAVIESSSEAYQEFLAAHQRHHTTHLARCGAETCADRPFWDPMATLLFEVTDAQQVYVVTAARAAIDDARVYRFASGALEVTRSEVNVDDEDIRRGLDLEFYPQALRFSKLERFLSAVHDVVKGVDPDQLAIAFDDAADPAVSIARMPDRTYDELLSRCADIFDAAELGTVSKFLHENRDESGLLVLRVRREFKDIST